jgi:ribosomal protein L40E
VHLSGRDLDEAILGVYGLRKVREEEPRLKPRICPRCQTPNPLDARFCFKCGLALDVKAALEVEEARKRTDTIMDLLIRDPEFRQLLDRKLKEIQGRPQDQPEGAHVRRS